METNLITTEQTSIPAIVNYNKKEIAENVGKIVTLIKDGYEDELDTLIFAKKGVEFFSQLEKAIRPIAEEKIKLAKSEVYSKFNMEVVVADTAVKYDYSVCGDPVWQRLKEQAEEATKKLKEREDMLKTIKSQQTMVDDESGEVFTVIPPTRSAKTGLKLTLK